MGHLTRASFPYQADTEGNLFPVIPLRLEHRLKSLDLLTLIDSGATISVFRPEIARELGINLETGKEIYLGGVGGRIKGYIHIVKITVLRKRFACPVVFSREYVVSFNLLGQTGFFEKFTISFVEKNNQVELD